LATGAFRTLGRYPSSAHITVRIIYIMRALIVISLIALGACTASQNQQVAQVVVDGQLFCAKATVAGPLVVALADMAGAPVTVTDKTANAVATACAVVAAAV
jgi:hypothetical protein